MALSKELYKSPRITKEDVKTFKGSCRHLCKSKKKLEFISRNSLP